VTDAIERRAYMLDERHIEFCEAMLQGKGLRQAYEAAGFDVDEKGYETARALLDRNDVQTYMAIRRAELMAKSNVNTERVIAEMSLIAFWDPAEAVGDDITCPRDIAKLPERVRRAIVGWKYDKFGNFILQWANKQTALDQLAKILGLYQKERTNDNDKSAEELMGQAFWKYVMSLHFHEGITVGEAWARAEREPEKVEAWAKAKGLIPATVGEIVVE
jgi:phage terminase small subunit